MTAMFEAHKLSYTYPGGLQAVRDVSLSISRVSMTAVIGANGSGKSNLVDAVRAQIATALPLLGANILLLYFLMYR